MEFKYHSCLTQVFPEYTLPSDCTQSRLYQSHNRMRILVGLRSNQCRFWHNIFTAVKWNKRISIHFQLCVPGCECRDYVCKNVAFVAANWLLQLILNGMKWCRKWARWRGLKPEAAGAYHPSYNWSVAMETGSERQASKMATSLWMGAFLNGRVSGGRRGKRVCLLWKKGLYK